MLEGSICEHWVQDDGVSRIHIFIDSDTQGQRQADKLCFGIHRAGTMQNVLTLSSVPYANTAWTTGNRACTFLLTMTLNVSRRQINFASAFIAHNPCETCILSHQSHVTTPPVVACVFCFSMCVPSHPVARGSAKVPRRLTEETVHGDTAAEPLVTYDFLDFKVGPQVCSSF